MYESFYGIDATDEVLATDASGNTTSSAAIPMASLMSLWAVLSFFFGRQGTY